MDTAGVARFGSLVKTWLGAVRKFLRNLCRKEPQMEKRTYRLGHHLVAFLDVLGQRDKFRGLKKPSNAQEEDEVKEVLRQTAGFVVEPVSYTHLDVYKRQDYGTGKALSDIKVGGRIIACSRDDSVRKSNYNIARSVVE